VEIYRRVISLDPNNLLAINNLAWILSESQGQYQQALEMAQKGLQLKKQYIDLIDTLGVIYYRMGKFDQAVENLTKAVELYPASSSQAVAATFHLARALAGAGQKDKASQLLNKALEMHKKVAGLSAEELSEAQLLLNNLTRSN
jgi:tetratricopeptide (TPR) repeat protein